MAEQWERDALASQLELWANTILDFDTRLAWLAFELEATQIDAAQYGPEEES